MDGEEIEKKLNELGKPYGMTSRDLKPDFDACKKESGATDLVVLGMVKKRLEDVFGSPEEEPLERSPAPPKPAPTTAAAGEPEIKELLEGEVAENSKIVAVEIKKAAELFGDKAKQPDRDIVKLRTENGADLVFSKPKGLEYIDGKWVVKNRVQAVRSVRNKLSKFGRFMEKYGCYPVVGTTVETSIDDSGFVKITV
jgi:hypothetical protein